MGCFVSSCQQALDEVIQESTTGKAQISFTIALDDIDSRASQALWENNDDSVDAEMGTDAENQIDLTSDNGLRVLVYNLNGDFLGEVTDKDIRKVSTNEYMFNGQLEVNNMHNEKLACRLEVYANCGNNMETFSYKTNFIPMWGIRDVELNLAKGELTTLTEPIYLLRSMAKVEVRLGTSVPVEYKLDLVKVDKYNTIGYIQPTGALEATATERMDMEMVFNPYDATVDTGLSFKMIEDDVFCVYIPEYDNSLVPAVITVIINGKDYTIEFKNYVDGKASGKAYNIVRNHYYQYTITSVAEQSVEVDFALKYQVMDWTNVVNPGMSFK